METFLDPASLHIFLIVADETSVTRAAKQLGRVPSNITTRIQLLEEQVGALLFSREGKKMTLTREGQIFLGYAKKMVALSTQARLALRKENQLETLRVGTMESTAASRLPPVLATFNEAWPQVSLRLTLGANAGISKGGDCRRTRLRSYRPTARSARMGGDAWA